VWTWRTKSENPNTSPLLVICLHGALVEPRDRIVLVESKKPVVAVEESRSIHFDDVGLASIWAAPSHSLTLPERLPTVSIGQLGMPPTRVTSPFWDLL
jgi:hypothetical protein